MMFTYDDDDDDDSNGGKQEVEIPAAAFAKASKGFIFLMR